MEKQIANIITGCRIFCSILMLFFPVFSSGFWVLYLLCGFSDMIDGTVARKTNSVSKFGAKLDTAADLIFTAAAFAKLLPGISVSPWLWAWIVVIALIKTGSMAAGLIVQKQFISLHTNMNRAVGLLLFLLPLSLRFIELQYSAPAVCMVATYAAVQEGYFVCTGRVPRTQQVSLSK